MTEQDDTPDALEELKEMLVEWDGQPYAPPGHVMVARSRIDRAIAAIESLRGEVREWLCVKCRTIYPGPPQKGFACVQCPKCGGDCGPRNFMELRRLQAVAALYGEWFGYAHDRMWVCRGCGLEKGKHQDGCPVGLYEEGLVVVEES
jgi:hypothetical protein